MRNASAPGPRDRLTRAAGVPGWFFLLVKPMRVFLDFETRSPCDLKKCGAYVYASHPETEVQCAAVKVDSEPCRVLIPKRVAERLSAFGELKKFEVIDPWDFCDLLIAADEIRAHNAEFERCILSGVFKIQKLPAEKFRCTAAKAAAMALPRDLAGASAVLDLATQKDPAGRRLMMAMAAPQAQGYRESAADYATLIRYCIQDVETEALLDASLPDLSPAEQALWVLDQKINDLGFAVDLPAVDSIIKILDENEAGLLSELPGLTGRTVNSPLQVAESLKWLEGAGLSLPDLTVDTVEDALARLDLPTAGVRRFLEIRRALARSSVAKFDAMRRMAGTGGRVRGTMLFHGATTGRWAGRGVQPQNFPRDVLKGPDKKPLTEAALFAFSAGDLSDVKAIADPVTAATACLRPVICAWRGMDLLCADLANIEGRVAAWLAGEDWKVEAFREFDAGRGADLYCLAYARSFGVPVESVTGDQRQVGKVCELALQYQGWAGAFVAMAKNYDVNLSEEKTVDVCAHWREAHPRIVAYWGYLESAAISAVQTGEVYRVGKVSFGVRGKWLHMRLPSGRLLAYFAPSLSEVERYGNPKIQLNFWAVDSYTRKWTKFATYGGCLFENAVQAIARDILAEAMQRVDREGFPVVLHVHDELVAEVPESASEKTLDRFMDCIRAVPVWATGCPIAAKGWRGKRYRKD